MFHTNVSTLPQRPFWKKKRCFSMGNWSCSRVTTLKLLWQTGVWEHKYHTGTLDKELRSAVAPTGIGINFKVQVFIMTHNIATPLQPQSFNITTNKSIQRAFLYQYFLPWSLIPMLRLTVFHFNISFTSFQTLKVSWISFKTNV